MNETGPSDITADRIKRDETPVMFVRAEADELESIQDAWRTLEETLGDLRGRKFAGSFDPATDEYRACVQIRDGDEPTALGLESGTLAGGTYLRARLRGEPPEVYDGIMPGSSPCSRPPGPPSMRNGPRSSSIGVEMKSTCFCR